MSATKTDRRAPAAVMWRALVAAVLGRRRPRRQRRHYPPRYVFLEHAAMAREMQRL